MEFQAVVGLAMNQIEMEKIAEAFDKNKNGLIDLTEIISVLKKGQTSHRVVTSVASKSMSDADKIELEVKKYFILVMCYVLYVQIKHQISQCTCHQKFKVVRVGDGQYRVSFPYCQLLC